MKINIIFPGFGICGGVIVGIRYAQALTNMGHDVMCYTQKIPYVGEIPRNLSGLKNFIKVGFGDIYEKEARERCGKFNYKKPLKISNLTVRDADITIATAWCTAFDVNKFKASKGRKFYFIQGYEVWDDQLKGMESYKLNLEHIVIAKWIDKILVEKLGCKPGTIIYNGIDLNIYKPNFSLRGNNSLRISMMYHVLPQKGIKDGLDVLGKIHKLYPDVKIVMFGKMDFYDKPEYIEYYKDPAEKKIVEIYQRSDIYLFPAIEEGWGLTVAESMACGCAVVGTNAGILNELGEHEKNALISEPRDVEALKNNVIRLIEEKETRERLQIEGLDLAKRLSLEESYRKFEKCLRTRPIQIF